MGILARNNPTKKSGTIIVSSREMAPVAFSRDLFNLEAPKPIKLVSKKDEKVFPNIRLEWKWGLNFVRNWNDMIRKMEGDWLFILGDDHRFAPDILMKLLRHDVDIVMPVVLTKWHPFYPVVYREAPEGNGNVIPVPLDGKTGLEEEYSVGNAGMLIKRHVLDVIGDPWFEMGRINPEVGSPDLWFCKKAREAGFKIRCDYDTRMGHIGSMEVFPARTDEGWGMELRSAGRNLLLPLPK